MKAVFLERKIVDRWQGIFGRIDWNGMIHVLKGFMKKEGTHGLM